MLLPAQSEELCCNAQGRAVSPRTECRAVPYSLQLLAWGQMNPPCSPKDTAGLLELLPCAAAPHACLPGSPCVTTLPKTGSVSSVEQFQRRLRNWYWHSSMASWAPRRTESITSRFLLHICTWRWIRPFSFSQVSSSEMLPTEDSFARYLPQQPVQRVRRQGLGEHTHVQQEVRRPKPVIPSPGSP